MRLGNGVMLTPRLKHRGYMLVLHADVHISHALLLLETCVVAMHQQDKYRLEGLEVGPAGISYCIAFVPHEAHCAGSNLLAVIMNQSRAQTRWFVPDYGTTVTVSRIGFEMAASEP